MMTRIALGILIGAGIGSVTGYFGKCSSGSCPLTATPARGAVYGGVLGLFLALTMGAPDRGGVSSDRTSPDVLGGNTETGSAAENAGALVHIGDATEFDSRVLQATVPCLVDFYSDYCSPCRMLGPTIEKLADHYQGQAVICKTDVGGGGNADLARRHGIGEIPAVLFFRDGEEVARFVGLRDEATYTAVLDGILQDAMGSANGAGAEQSKSAPLKNR